MSGQSELDFIVRKTDWAKTRFVERELEEELAPGQLLFRVDRFAFTANNISYAMAGDLLGYWRFFPAEEGWGRVPAMGFGDVIASTQQGVEVGTRCFGFFPMSRHLRIEPSHASPTSIVDGVPHRAEIAAVYNTYQPVRRDGFYSPEFEDELLLLRGLFMTSFLAEDFIAEHGYYDAESVVISSASSKTSIALAFRLRETEGARAIGLTSEGNRDFVESLGCYDQVLDYEAIDAIPGSSPAIFVDMADNGAVTRAVHEHLGPNLRYSQSIGGTHWQAIGGGEGIPGPKREFFFAPAQIAKRSRDWGPQGLQERLGASLKAFMESSRKWLRVERDYGREAVERVYEATRAGNARPDRGHILSLWDDAGAAAGE